MSATDLDSRIAGVSAADEGSAGRRRGLLAEVEAALAKTGDELARARARRSIRCRRRRLIAIGAGRNVRR